ncbi:MAG: HAD-IA family hydrolase [Caulobacteraceae bacterium]
MTKLVVWDVDGTLVDSRQTIFESVKSAFATMGFPEPTYETVRQIVGLKLIEGIHSLLPHLSEAEAERVADGYRAAFGAKVNRPGYVEPLYDGAAETLDRLRAGGWKIAIATGKSRRGVDTIIRMHGWADLFDSTHCSDDGPGKPHPAMVLEAMKALQVGPESTIVVGDTAHDMRMAKAAGAYAQGVSWGFHTIEEVQDGGADHIAHDFAELDRQLDAFAERARNS